MKTLIYIGIIIVFCGLQAALVPLIGVQGQVPNLLMLLTLVFVLDKTNNDYLFVALFCGLFLDFYSGAFIGTFSFPLLVVSFSASWLLKYVLAVEINMKYLPLILAVFMAGFYFSIVLFSWAAFRLTWSVSFLPWNIIKEGLFAGFIYNVLFLYPMYVFVGQLRLFMDKYITREYLAR